MEHVHCCLNVKATPQQTYLLESEGHLMQSPLAHLHEGLCEICATEMIFHCHVGVELRVGKASALCLVDMEGLWWAARGKQSTH